MLKLGKTDEALVFFQEDLTLMRALVAAEPGSPDLRSDLALAHLWNGRALLESGGEEGAMTHWLEARAILVALVQEEPQNADFQGQLEALEQFLASENAGL